MQAELAAALRRAERGEAEAALARQLLATLRVAPRERDGGGGGGRRRKGGSSAATAPEEQGDGQGEAQQDELGEEQGDEPGAALPNDQDEGNDSSDGSDDSKD
ncbi:hypothetical protein LMG23992_04067 [Cupriavidus laharis]|uniref:Uncharacterized protein n=1 Tax=Cupriavidus laharis TaxID=151654 RepID=A0ABN7Z5U1_9BURK|nr:hypothetical protein LMG23992_04067 [Cupriavidus laharis]